MTVAAAIYDPTTSTAWIGADTLVNDRGVRAYHSKLLRLEPHLVVAQSGWTVPLTWLRRRVREEPLPALTSAEETSDTLWTLWQDCRAWCQEQGANQPGPGWAQHGCELLAASPWGIWVCDPCGDVRTLGRTWHAIGSGSDVALGALWTLQAQRARDRHWETSALGEEDLKTALAAAAALDLHVGGELELLEVGEVDQGGDDGE